MLTPAISVSISTQNKLGDQRESPADVLSPLPERNMPKESRVGKQVVLLKGCTQIGPLGKLTKVAALVSVEDVAEWTRHRQRPTIPLPF